MSKKGGRVSAKMTPGQAGKINSKKTGKPNLDATPKVSTKPMMGIKVK